MKDKQDIIVIGGETTTLIQDAIAKATKHLVTIVDTVKENTMSTDDARKSLEKVGDYFIELKENSLPKTKSKYHK